MVASPCFASIIGLLSLRAYLGSLSSQTEKRFLARRETAWASKAAQMSAVTEDKWPTGLWVEYALSGQGAIPLPQDDLRLPARRFARPPPTNCPRFPKRQRGAGCTTTPQTPAMSMRKGPLRTCRTEPPWVIAISVFRCPPSTLADLFAPNPGARSGLSQKPPAYC